MNTTPSNDMIIDYDLSENNALGAIGTTSEVSSNEVGVSASTSTPPTNKELNDIKNENKAITDILLRNEAKAKSLLPSNDVKNFDYKRKLEEAEKVFEFIPPESDNYEEELLQPYFEEANSKARYIYCYNCCVNLIKKSTYLSNIYEKISKNGYLEQVARAIRREIEKEEASTTSLLSSNEFAEMESPKKREYINSILTENDGIVHKIQLNSLTLNDYKKTLKLISVLRKPSDQEIEQILKKDDETRSKDDHIDLYNDYVSGIRDCKTVKDFLRFLPPFQHEAKAIKAELSKAASIDRVLSIEYGLDVPLVDTLDLHRLKERIEDDLFGWFDKSRETNCYTTHKAPYFPMVQSSGTGKTRLLVELRNHYHPEIAENVKNKLKDKSAEDLMAETETETRKRKPDTAVSATTDHATMETDENVVARESIMEVSCNYIACRLVLCAGQKSPKQVSCYHDEKWNVDDYVRNSKQVEEKKVEAYEGWISKYVTRVENEEKRQGKVCKKLVLLFDEAQYLTKGQGLAFRVVRWYLRQRRQNIHVVAVFTGTTSRLSNFYNDSPSTGYSRTCPDGYYNYNAETDIEKSEESDKLLKLYAPFYQLMTIGCLCRNLNEPYNEGGSSNSDVNTNNNNNNNNEENVFGSDWLDPEWERAAYFGRPLFAVKQWKDGFNTGRVEKGKDVLCSFAMRMLLMPYEGADWSINDAAQYSVLGTRVQLGVVQNQVMACEIVERGYANLVGFKQFEKMNKEGLIQPSASFYAQISFLPDPVVAWLAMRMMIPAGIKSVQDSSSVVLEGKDKQYWSKAAASMFLSHLCLPAKGDCGEVMAALYMLFCADDLRYENNPNMSKFSVSLQDWYDKLLERAYASASFEEYNPEVRTRSMKAKPVAAGKQVKQEGCSYGRDEMHVNFIQVCRSYVHQDLWCDPEYLRDIYHAALACYTPPQWEIFDMFFATRVLRKSGKSDESEKSKAKVGKEVDPYDYHAVIVSVKNWHTMSEQQMRDHETIMRAYAKKHSRDKAVLCLLFVFRGQEDNRDTKTESTPKSGTAPAQKEGPAADNSTKSESTTASESNAVPEPATNPGTSTRSTSSTKLPIAFPKETVSCRVVVEEDHYGVCEALKSTSFVNEEAEIMASCSYLQGKCKGMSEEKAKEYAKGMLRKNRKKKPVDKNMDLVKSFIQS